MSDELPPRKFRMGDPGCSFVTGSRIVIFLDGERQTDCLGYDCDAGTVEKLVLGDHGEPLIDHEPDANGELVQVLGPDGKPKVLTEIVTGAVEVKWLEAA